MLSCSLLYAFTLNVYDLLYVFNSETVVQYIHIVNVQLWPSSPDCFDPSNNNNQGFDPFFFLGVRMVQCDNVEEPSISWDIPLENSVPLPAVYVLLHYDTEKSQRFPFVFCSRLLLKSLFVFQTSENVPSGSSQPKTCVVFFLCEVLLLTILGYWYFLSFNRRYHNTSLLLEL